MYPVDLKLTQIVKSLYGAVKPKKVKVGRRRYRTPPIDIYYKQILMYFRLIGFLKIYLISNKLDQVITLSL